MSPFLSAQQIAGFAATGFVVVPDLIPPATVEKLRADADEVLESRLADIAATRTQDPRLTWWRLASGRPYVLKIKPVIDLSRTASAVADGPEIPTVVADLLGGTPRLMENKFMYKQVVEITADWAELPILGEEVCKHTDAAYFTSRGYRRVLTVAVCLDACTEESGALRVWPRSHLRTIEMVTTDNQGPVVPDTEAPDREAVTLMATPGSVLVWDSALVHASGPNASGLPRRLLVLGYAQAGDGPR